MKARVIATGKIVEVKEEYDLREAIPQVFYSNEEDPYEVYEKEELDFNVNDNMNPTIDYWTRLEHQAAIAAMQGLMSYVGQITPKKGRSFCDEIVDISFKVAQALVEKYRKEEK